MTTPVIVASGGANIASLRYALERLGHAAQVTADAGTIARASHVILPGVGAAADAMTRLTQSGLATLIPQLRQPVLGICLGMQLLFESSEEGDARCLGVMRGQVRRMTSSPGHPVPHMGWNRIAGRRVDALLAGTGDGEFAYFAHSYCVAAGEATLASCEYGDPFAAVVRRQNFCGAQFHPERSGAFGSRFLANFLGCT